MNSTSGSFNSFSEHSHRILLSMLAKGSDLKLFHKEVMFYKDF